MTEPGPARSRSLVAKLALATLLVALALSLLASAYVIAADSRAFRADTLEQIERLQRLVAPPAAEAAYQLNADQAESLVAACRPLTRSTAPRYSTTSGAPWPRWNAKVAAPPGLGNACSGRIASTSANCSTRTCAKPMVQWGCCVWSSPPMCWLQP